jgi:hypothetical protein
MDIKPEYIAREQEFREMTRAWILKKHAKYLKSAEQLKNTKPIRHPRGTPPANGHTIERLWADSIWCQDSSWDPMCEFFEIEFGDEFEDTDNDTCNWANQIFNDEFKAVLPELAHVLEG